jgi:hypothetical protein
MVANKRKGFNIEDVFKVIMRNRKWEKRKLKCSGYLVW